MTYMNRLQQIEDVVRASTAEVNAAENTGLRARWASGSILLKFRQGKRLPNGTLRKLTLALSVSRSELDNRMKFAEKFPTEEELTNAVGKFKSWHAITEKALTDTPRTKDHPTHPLVQIITLLKKPDTGRFGTLGEYDYYRLLDEIELAARSLKAGVETLQRAERPTTVYEM